MIAREIAIEATRLLIGYSVAISTLEMLATRELFAADGLLSWRVLRTGTYRLRGRAESIRDAMFGEGGMLAHLVLRMALALVLMLPVPGTIWGSCAFVLLASGLVLTYRSMFGGDGSDQMTTIVLAGIGYEAFAVPGIFADAGLWFIAGQLVVSYFAAGVAKLVSPQWRRGTATVDVLRSACYGSRSAVRILETIPGGSAAASWAVMSFEVAFPLALIAPPPVAIAFLVMGFAFHLGNAAFMGLNTFLTAFLAAYPAMLYVLR